MRLLGTGCYTKLRDTQQGKTSQTTTILILDFGAEANLAGLRWAKMFLLDPKNKPQHMRALYGMHLLTHERI
jgi:hypothetical protein